MTPLAGRLAQLARDAALPDAADVAAACAELADPFADGAAHAALAELALAAGAACAAAGRHRDADRLLSAGLRVLTPAGGPAVVRGRVERAAVWHHDRRHDDVIRETAALPDAVRPLNDPLLLGRLLTVRGGSLAARGRAADALAALDEAVRLFRRLVGEEVRVGVCEHLRAGALAALDRPDEARAAADEAVAVFARHGHAGMQAEAEKRQAALRADALRRGREVWDGVDAREEAEGPPAALVDLTRAAELLAAGGADALELARCRRDRAGALARCGRVPEAVAEYAAVQPELRRLAPPAEWIHARAMWGMGLHQVGRSAEGLALVEEALAAARRHDPGDLTTQCLTWYAAILGEVGRAAEAVPVAWEVVHRITDDTPPLERVMRFLALGAALSHVGRVNEAVVAYQLAAERLRPADPPRLAAAVWAHLAQAYLQLGQHDAARPLYEQARPVFDALGLRLEQAMCATGVAKIHRHAGAYHAARAAAVEAVELLAGLGRAAPLAVALTDLAAAEVELGNPAAALAHTTEAAAVLAGYGGVAADHARVGVAVVRLLGGDADGALDQYARVDPTVFSGEAAFRFHFGFGLALLMRQRPADGLPHLRDSVAAYRRALREAGAGELALEFFGRRSQFGEAVTELTLAAGEAELAFELGQVGKGVLVQDFLRRRGHPLRYDSPAVQEARRLLVAHFLADFDPGRYAAPVLPLEAVRHAYQSECRMAELAARDGAPADDDPGRVLDAVRAALPPHWAVLDLWDAGGGDLRVFVVTRERLTVVPVAVSDPDGSFARRLELMRARIADPEYLPDGWADADGDRVWDDLHAAVFAPLDPVLAEQGVTGLYLVPHGAWHGVPLHAARTWEWAAPRYLCDRYDVAYLPSAAALPHLPPPLVPTTCLSLANPDRDSPKSLPGAEPEAERLAAAFASHGGGTYRAGPDATLGAAAWAAADFVHFACHGDGDPAFAGTSRLYLAGDCLLAHDVMYRLDPLRPGTVVLLNGCRTGVKDWRAVDEGMGLMTAFLLRGAAAVVATQWNLVDDFAERAAVAFAEELLAGAPPTRALRAAVRAGRAAGFDDPFVWAVFQLTGRAV